MEHGKAHGLFSPGGTYHQNKDGQHQLRKLASHMLLLMISAVQSGGCAL
jgi:hypothetical protein